MKILIIVIFILFILFCLNFKKEDFNSINDSAYNKKNILVMFSGGLDSTTALYYLLKNTDSNLYVHHINLQDNSNKSQEELITCNKMVKEFKKIRNFEYSQSKYSYITDNIDRNTSVSRQDDLSVIIFQAIRICTIRNYLNIDHIVIADSKYDKHNTWDVYFQKSIDAAYYNHWYGTKPTSIDVLKSFYIDKPINDTMKYSITNDILKDIKLPYEIQNTISHKEIIYKLCKLMTIKKEMYHYLPKNIRSMILSCRNSKNGIKCSKCFKCKLEELYIK